MLAIEVALNGQMLAVGGAEDLCVLSAIVSATGKLGSESAGTHFEDTDNDISLRLGGLTSRKCGKEDEHLTWINGKDLRIGDVVTVRLLETYVADPRSGESSAGGNLEEDNEKNYFELCKKEYFRLKDKYDPPKTPET